MTLPAPTVALFYYDIAYFFNLSSLESMYRSEATVDQSGLNRMDYLALTGNDKQFYDLLLRRAAADCYAVLQPLGRASTEGFIYNALPKRTVAQINDMVELEDNLHFEMSDAGTITLGNLVVAAKDIVYYNGTNWVKDNASTLKYILFTLSLPWNFDLNNNFGLDEKIKEYISIFIVYHWFRRKGYSLELILPEWTDIRRDLGMIVNYRTTVKRSSRTF